MLHCLAFCSTISMVDFSSELIDVGWYIQKKRERRAVGTLSKPCTMSE